MRWFLAALVTLAAPVTCADETVEGPRAHPPATVTFEGTDAILHVEIADDVEEQGRGLMGVEDLPTDQGMAFVYDEPTGGAFWMKDTLIPLSIAFVDEDG